MVDGWTGKWYPEEDYNKYPKEKWCDYDRLCIAIRKDGYTPETDMENLITMVFAYYYNPDNDYEGGEISIEEYVKESGGWKEFDYEA